MLLPETPSEPRPAEGYAAPFTTAEQPAPVTDYAKLAEDAREQVKFRSEGWAAIINDLADQLEACDQERQKFNREVGLRAKDYHEQVARATQAEALAQRYRDALEEAMARIEMLKRERDDALAAGDKP